MMVAAVVAALHHRRAAEFAAPNHQRVFEQAALLEILDERGAGLVGVRDSSWSDVSDQVAMLVPGFVVELHEAHAALDQPAGEQAIVGKRRLARLGAVQLEHVLRFLGRIHQLRRAALHPEGHLEGVDARGDLRIARRRPAASG